MSFAPVIGVARNSAAAPRASIRIDGFWSTFLYHCVSEPCTGRRYSLFPSRTNQTGIEIVCPYFLPMTLILIWRYRERRSLRIPFELGTCASFMPIPKFMGRMHRVVEGCIAYGALGRLLLVFSLLAHKFQR